MTNVNSDDDDVESGSSRPFTNSSGSEDDDEWIDLSVLKVGFRPIPGSSYELIKRLDDGCSGFGEVWKGHSNRMRQSAAFKFCKRPLDRHSLLTLHNELRLVRDLNHPGIVKIEAEYLDSKIPFLQYEFIEGIDFSKLLRERFSEGGGGPLPPDHAAALILKLANIMAVPHSRRQPIVHKDLKPQNILVANYHDLCAIKELGISPDLRLAALKVMDFGIGAHSRFGKGATAGSQSIGKGFEGFRTVAYASPQQEKGLPAHESDDIFAIGVIWYELLVGEMGHGPPIGRDWTELRSRMKLRGMSDPQFDILEQCLEPSRKHRIHNAIELAKKIEQVYVNPDYLPSLTDILKNVLSKKTRCLLSLNRLTTLSVEVADALGKWYGMSSNPVDRAFSSLSLDGLTTLSVEVANAIANWKGTTLSFNGLTTLSVEAADALANWKGSSLSLYGLTALSVEVADALVKWKGCSLDLNGLTTLSVETADALANWEGTDLSLDGLTTISVEAADALGNWKGNFLCIKGLTTLSVGVADALVKRRRYILLFSGLTVLSVEVANAIANWKGTTLSFNGLTALSVEAADAIANWKGTTLSFNGLTTLSVEAADALANWKGSSLSLYGLTALSVEVADALVKWKGCSLDLNGLTTLSVETADALANWDGTHLSLDGLTTLSVEAADALGNWKGIYLSFRGLTTLLIGVADAFVKWKGSQLYFNNPIEIDELLVRARPELLCSAAENGAVGMANYLIDYQMYDPNWVNSSGLTPLLIGCKNSHWEIVKILIYAEAATNVSEPDDQNTPLHLAAKAGNAAIVKRLLKYDADINKRNAEGKTPLHCAADSGDLETIRILVAST